MATTALTMQQIFAATNSIVPVITLTDVKQAEPLANVLQSAGFPVLEITLRTPAGLAAIEQLTNGDSELIVGAGTVLSRAQANAAMDAGAQFLVSPGFADAVHQSCTRRDRPYLPGVGTVTEAMSALDLGYTALKLFPANLAGGPAMLRALHSVLPELTFCPTGGVDEATLLDYLSVPNVACVGGSWLVPGALIEQGEWQEIGQIARGASALVARVSG